MGSQRKVKAASAHQRKGSSSSPSSSSHLHPESAHALDSDSFSADYDDEYDHDYDDEDDDEEEVRCNHQNLDFSKVLQDVEGSLVGTMTSGVMAISHLFSSSPTSAASRHSFRVTWKELMYLVLAIVILAGLSILMGVSAGITISIHYFDTHTSPSFPRLEARERDLGPHQRVTTVDYSIVSSNVLQHPSVGTPTSRSPTDINDLTLGRVITMSKSGQRKVLMVVEETIPLGAGDNETRAHSPENGHTQTDGISSSSDEGDYHARFQGKYKPFRHHSPPDSRFQLSSSTVYPTICSDGVTIGYDDWYTLKAAIEELNGLAAERFMKWNEYFASLDTSGNNPTASPRFHNDASDNPHLRPNSPYNEAFLRQYYDDDAVFTVCPGSTLRARKGPIFVNAENIIIECGDPEEYYHKHSGERSSYQSISYPVSLEMPTCTFDVGGTHLSFGPSARNILVRGLAFQSATSSSLAFHYNGAQASFEDCVWVNNAGIPGGKYGAVADVNSTSNLNFYRCEIGPDLGNLVNMVGQGGAGSKNGDPVQTGVPGGSRVSGLNPNIASVLSLRN